MSANRGRPFAGVYEMMQFPEYRYQEYPKAVQVEDPNTGKTVEKIATNETEELELLGVAADETTAETEVVTGRRRRG